MAKNQFEIQRLHRELATHNLITASRVDYIERVLFGEVVAKLDEQRTRVTASARPATWQKNLDKELRDRISFLERRMFKVETAVEERLKVGEALER